MQYRWLFYEIILALLLSTCVAGNLVRSKLPLAELISASHVVTGNSKKEILSPCARELRAKKIDFSSGGFLSACHRAVHERQDCPPEFFDYAEILYLYAYALVTKDSQRASSFLEQAEVALLSCARDASSTLLERIHALSAQISQSRKSLR